MPAFSLDSSDRGAAPGFAQATLHTTHTSGGSGTPMSNGQCVPN